MSNDLFPSQPAISWPQLCQDLIQLIITNFDVYQFYVQTYGVYKDLFCEKIVCHIACKDDFLMSFLSKLLTLTWWYMIFDLQYLIYDIQYTITIYECGRQGTAPHAFFVIFFDYIIGWFWCTKGWLRELELEEPALHEESAPCVWIHMTFVIRYMIYDTWYQVWYIRKYDIGYKTYDVQYTINVAKIPFPVITYVAIHYEKGRRLKKID